MSQIIIMATIIIYLAAVVYIGVLCSKKNNAVDDFYLGGRKLGPFVTAMSAEASDMSSCQDLLILQVLRMQRGQL